jgi:hypothetical protein
VRRLAICRLLLVILVAAVAAGDPVYAQVTAPVKTPAEEPAKTHVNPPAKTTVKRHQATGTVAASGTTQLILLKTFGRNQARWNFVLNPKTKLEGKLTKGERVRIYYYSDAKEQRVAEEIKVLAPATSAAVNKAPAAAGHTPPPQKAAP